MLKLFKLLYVFIPKNCSVHLHCASSRVVKISCRYRHLRIVAIFFRCTFVWPSFKIALLGNFLDFHGIQVFLVFLYNIAKPGYFIDNLLAYFFAFLRKPLRLPKGHDHKWFFLLMSWKDWLHPCAFEDITRNCILNRLCGQYKQANIWFNL